MDKKQQIRERLRTMAGKDGPVQTLLAIVESVDVDEYTCVLNDDDILIYDVRLRPVINENESLTLVPKVGSWVLAIRIEDDEEWMVIAVDEVDRYRIVVGNMLFQMKDGKFMVSSGAESLGKLIDELILQIQAIYAPKNSAAITLIQNRFKALLSGT
jgi:hypothetical protein